MKVVLIERLDSGFLVYLSCTFSVFVSFSLCSFSITLVLYLNNKTNCWFFCYKGSNCVWIKNNKALMNYCLLWWSGVIYKHVWFFYCLTYFDRCLFITLDKVSNLILSGWWKSVLDFLFDIKTCKNVFLYRYTCTHFYNHYNKLLIFIIII